MTSWSSALMANDSPIRVLRKPGRTMRTASWRLPVQRLNPWWITTKRWLSVLPLWKLTKIASKLHLAGQLLALFMVVWWTAFAQVRRPLSSTKTLEQVLKTGYAPPTVAQCFAQNITKHHDCWWNWRAILHHFIYFYIHVSCKYSEQVSCIAVFIRLILKITILSPNFSGGGSDTEQEEPVAPWSEEGEHLGESSSHHDMFLTCLAHFRLWLAECGVPMGPLVTNRLRNHMNYIVIGIINHSYGSYIPTLVVSRGPHFADAPFCGPHGTSYRSPKAEGAEVDLLRSSRR